MSALKKIHIAIALLVVACAYPVEAQAQAQSVWLRTQVSEWTQFHYDESVAAADSTNFIYAPSRGEPFGGMQPAQSADYGDTWARLFPQSAHLPWNIISIVHPSRNLIILGCDDQFLWRDGNNIQFTISEVDVGHIVRSTDGGITWEDRALGRRDTSIHDRSLQLKISSPVGAIAALDSDHVFIALANDHYLHSTDGGYTWDSIICPIESHYAGTYNSFGTKNPIAAYPGRNTLVVAEVDSSYDYANHACKIFRSTNAGATWNAGFQTSNNITGFAFVSPVVGFASGYIMDANGPGCTATIDKTTDGGESWFRLYTHRFSNAGQLISIGFADSLHGLAVGDSIIIRTTDGGNSWLEMAADISEGDYPRLTDVAYPDTNHAMIACSTGEVYIYRPDTMLNFPHITNPKYDEILPLSVTVQWDPVPGATRYHVQTYYNSHTLADTTITGTQFYMSDTATRQLDFYVTAVSDTRTSNRAYRTIRLFAPASVEVTPDQMYLYISAYPNPATDVLHCTLHGTYSNRTGALTCGLYDVLGRRLLDLSGLARSSDNGSISEFDVPTQGLASGVYLLSYTLGAYSYSRPILIDR